MRTTRKERYDLMIEGEGRSVWREQEQRFSMQHVAWRGKRELWYIRIRRLLYVLVFLNDKFL